MSRFSWMEDVGCIPRRIGVNFRQMPDIEWRSEMTHVCDVPAELGQVTSLDVRNDKVVATTESGIKMILPAPR